MRAEFCVCYQNYFNHKFSLLNRNIMQITSWLFVYGNSSFNTLIACRLLCVRRLASSWSFLNFLLLLLASFSFTKKKKKPKHRRLILCKNNFHAYTLITCWKICFTLVARASSLSIEFRAFCSICWDGEGENIQIKCFSPTPTPLRLLRTAI